MTTLAHRNVRKIFLCAEVVALYGRHATYAGGASTAPTTSCQLKIDTVVIAGSDPQSHNNCCGDYGSEPAMTAECMISTFR